MIQNPECQVEALDPAGNGMLLKVQKLRCGTTCNLVGNCSTWWSRMVQCLEGAKHEKETFTRGCKRHGPAHFPTP